MTITEFDARVDERDVFAAILGAGAPEIRVAEGETICRAGDAADSWWYVVDGFADVTLNGRYLATLGPGETIGELALLDSRARSASVVAKSDMRLLVGGADDLFEAIRSQPDVALALARELAGRLRHLNDLGVPPVRPEPAATRAAQSRPVSPPAGRVAFDPLAPGYFDDPTVQLNALREQEAVHFVEMTGAYLCTRYEHVHSLGRDRRLASEVTYAASTPAIDAEKAQFADVPREAWSILQVDGDDHHRLRRLMQLAFTPKAIAQWRDRAVAVTDDLLDSMAAAGGGDVIEDFALRLPVQIISEMLGVPTTDVPQLRAWSHILTKTLDPICSMDDRMAAMAARSEFVDYLGAMYAAKRERPDDGMFSLLIQAEAEGQRLTPTEVVANVLLLYVAGHETTTNLIGNGVVELLRHPDQLDRVRVNPDLDANLIEEVLRYNSPVQFTRRITLEPVTIGGVDVPTGSVLMLCAASANRDPRKWGPTADEFLVDRPGANDQVSFGGGPHFCLGAALARLEGQVALPRLMRRFPDIRFTSEPVFEPRMVLRGCPSLPVDLSRAPSHDALIGRAAAGEPVPMILR